MSALKRIAFNCRKATFLIEKKNLASISIQEEIELKLHLAGCSVCQLFQKQSFLIDKMVKKHFFTDKTKVVLDENFKKDLSKRIVYELDKE
jgi:hypothetical protein